MLIRIGYELRFDVSQPTPMLLMLYVHPESAFVLERPQRLEVSPPTPITDYFDSFGNRPARIVAPAGQMTVRYDNVARDSGQPEPSITGLSLTPAEWLPPECMRFLLASRYCEVDLMTPVAWDLFGKTPATWERIQAVLDWVHGNITFGYQFARPTKTALDVYMERRGVCRDFQHLAITFLRALNVPARYATGYLGDIGVPPSPDPMDFSAWLEAYVGGVWYTLDARHNQPRVGRVLMARGRDAVDAALTTAFGPANLTGFTVWTDELPASA